MNKITKKLVNKILEEYKINMSIADSIKKFEVNHVDFFEFLFEDIELQEKYNKYRKYNNFLEAEFVKNRSIYGVDRDDNKIYCSDKIAFEIIKAHDKDLYSNKDNVYINHSLDLSRKSMSELDEIIKNISENPYALEERLKKEQEEKVLLEIEKEKNKEKLAKE